MAGRFDSFTFTATRPGTKWGELFLSTSVALCISAEAAAATTVRFAAQSALGLRRGSSTRVPRQLTVAPARHSCRSPLIPCTGQALMRRWTPHLRSALSCRAMQATPTGLQHECKPVGPRPVPPPPAHCSHARLLRHQAHNACTVKQEPSPEQAATRPACLLHQRLPQALPHEAPHILSVQRPVGPLPLCSRAGMTGRPRMLARQHAAARFVWHGHTPPVAMCVGSGHRSGCVRQHHPGKASLLGAPEGWYGGITSISRWLTNCASAAGAEGRMQVPAGLDGGLGRPKGFGRRCTGECARPRWRGNRQHPWCSAHLRRELAGQPAATNQGPQPTCAMSWRGNLQPSKGLSPPTRGPQPNCSNHPRPSAHLRHEAIHVERREANAPACTAQEHQPHRWAWLVVEHTRQQHDEREECTATNTCAPSSNANQAGHNQAA